MQRPTVLGDLRRAVEAGRIPRRTVRQELRDNLTDKLRRGETLFPGIIGYDESVIPQILQRDPLAARPDHPGTARTGEDAHPARAGRPARRRAARGGRLRDQLRSARAALPRLPRPRAGGGRRPARFLAAAVAAVRREAGHAGRDDCRHDWRHRSDQGGAGRAAALRRAGRALRPAAARQPRHLRRQRAARPGGQDPGRPVQHPPGGRRPDKGVSGAPAPRRHDGVHGQSRGLHGARQDRHPAQGPHRVRDPHALSRNAERRGRHHAPGGVGGPRGGGRGRRRHDGAAVRARDGRGNRVPGAGRQARRRAFRGQPAAADPPAWRT